MDSTLWELQCFDRAHEIALKERDSLNYVLGEYQYEALIAAISGVLSKQKNTIKTFKDIREEPVLAKVFVEDDNEDEEDAQKTYEQYLVRRQIDKLNWDLQQMYQS